MRLSRLWLTDFRCYDAIDVESRRPGCTVITGANGQGKTSLLEAVAWVATGEVVPWRSRRRARAHRHDEAIVRAEIVDADGRAQLLEAEIRAVGRNRVLVNQQAAARGRRDLRGPPARHRVLTRRPRLVKERPGRPARLPRRAARHDRAALRRRCAATSSGCCASATRCCGSGCARRRRRSPHSTCSTTSWSRPAASSSGAACGWSSGSPRDRARPTRRSPASPRHGRRGVRGRVGRGHARPTDGSTTSSCCCAALRERCGGASSTAASPWSARTATTGGSRSTGSTPARHASQGEQRTLALGLRLAGHGCRAEITGSEPVLLLDDVFSELDPRPRRRARRAPAGGADAADDRGRDPGGPRPGAASARPRRPRRGRHVSDR